MTVPFITRAGKGSPLTHAEMDGNLNLSNAGFVEPTDNIRGLLLKNTYGRYINNPLLTQAIPQGSNTQLVIDNSTVFENPPGVNLWDSATNKMLQGVPNDKMYMANLGFLWDGNAAENYFNVNWEVAGPSSRVIASTTLQGPIFGGPSMYSYHQEFCIWSNGNDIETFGVEIMINPIVGAMSIKEAQISITQI